jgi:hypothetical protein
VNTPSQPPSWRLDKTVNLPVLLTLGTIGFTVVTWSNNVTTGLERERTRVTNMEGGLAQQRLEQGQIRSELIQQQSQVRIELNQQLNKIETEIKGEIRELRNDIKGR